MFFRNVGLRRKSHIVNFLSSWFGMTLTTLSYTGLVRTNRGIAVHLRAFVCVSTITISDGSSVVFYDRTTAYLRVDPH